ncbi:hypothetical protein ACFPPD_06735 [Cohnella suwonensis]|uniref:Uncharacterized protein n=1 Tax=Cohnella suwonensis TaxID=696072 RepID=A0ABW0LR84_9BACL
MSYREIIAAIDGYQSRLKIEQERMKADMQVQAIVAYREANLISVLVSRLLGGKAKSPTLAEAFPGIFPEEMLASRTQDWRIMKDRIASYGVRHRKRGEQRGNHDRGTTGAGDRGDEATPPGT